MDSKLTLYHGAARTSSQPYVPKSSIEDGNTRRTDFSACRYGFYLTPDRACAYEWAQDRAIPGTIPVIAKFELDLRGLKVYDFGYDPQDGRYQKWKELVTWSYTNRERVDHPEFKDYDVIVGLTSKGTLGGGRVDVSEFLRVGAGSYMPQVAVLTNKALAKLKFLGVEDQQKEDWLAKLRK